MNNKKNALLLSVLLTTAAHAVDPPPAADTTAEPFNVEVFEGAKPLKGPGEDAYPPREKYGGKEGWVLINLMVDPNGKPHDPTVVDSTGNPVLETAAVQALDKMSFQPAKLGKTPVDSSLTFKMVFRLGYGGDGASPGFAKEFTLFQKAVNAGDRVAADAELPKLDARNLYEDAFKAYGQYLYDHQWGTAEDQLKDLKRAIAGEESGIWVPGGMFPGLLAAQLVLQAQTSDYGGALETWKRLSWFKAAPIRKQLEPLGTKLLALQKSPAPFSQSGKIGPGTSWNGYLFKLHFAIRVAGGSISEIKLRCKRKYIFFKYEPGTQYTVNSGAGDCYMELVGDPGTAFEITQS